MESLRGNLRMPCLSCRSANSYMYAHSYFALSPTIAIHLARKCYVRTIRLNYAFDSVGDFVSIGLPVFHSPRLCANLHFYALSRHLRPKGGEGGRGGLNRFEIVPDKESMVVRLHWYPRISYQGRRGNVSSLVKVSSPESFVNYRRFETFPLGQLSARWSLLSHHLHRL